MIGVVIGNKEHIIVTVDFNPTIISASRKANVNPDNVATPIAASLGDLVTLAILAQTASIIFNLKDSEGVVGFLIHPGIFYPLVILSTYCFLVIPMCSNEAKKSDSTKDLLSTGWTPGKPNHRLNLHLTSLDLMDPLFQFWRPW